MTEAEAMALLGSALPGYGARDRALRAAGSALALLAEPDAFRETLGEALPAVRSAVRQADRLLDDLRRTGTALILRDAEGWPSRLSEIRHPPHLLFCDGTPDLTDPVMLGCVGTRDPSAYGLRQARRIARELAEAGDFSFILSADQESCALVDRIEFSER